MIGPTTPGRNPQTNDLRRAGEYAGRTAKRLRTIEDTRRDLKIATG